MATELDLQTTNDGSVYLARKSDGRLAHVFTLSVTDGGWRGEAAEVDLTRRDLLQLIDTCAKLLAEDED